MGIKKDFLKKGKIYLKGVKEGKKQRPLLESLTQSVQSTIISWEWEEQGGIWGLKKKKILDIRLGWYSHIGELTTNLKKGGWGGVGIKLEFWLHF